MTRLPLTEMDFRFHLMTRLHWTLGFVHWNLVESIGHVCFINRTAMGPARFMFYTLFLTARPWAKRDSWFTRGLCVLLYLKTVN